MNEHVPEEHGEETQPMRVFGEGDSAMTTGRDAAAYLEVHENTLRRWADKGLLPVVIFPSGTRRYLISGVVQLRERMYADVEEAEALREEVNELSAKARALLEEPRLKFTDEIINLLQGLAAGRTKEEMSLELGVETEKIERIVNIGLRQLEHLREASS